VEHSYVNWRFFLEDSEFRNGTLTVRGVHDFLDYSKIRNDRNSRNECLEGEIRDENKMGQTKMLLTRETQEMQELKYWAAENKLTWTLLKKLTPNYLSFNIYQF